MEELEHASIEAYKVRLVLEELGIHGKKYRPTASHLPEGKTFIDNKKMTVG